MVGTCLCVTNGSFAALSGELGSAAASGQGFRWSRCGCWASQSGPSGRRLTTAGMFYSRPCLRAAPVESPQCSVDTCVEDETVDSSSASAVRDLRPPRQNEKQEKKRKKEKGKRKKEKGKRKKEKEKGKRKKEKGKRKKEKGKRKKGKKEKRKKGKKEKKEKKEKGKKEKRRKKKRKKKKGKKGKRKKEKRKKKEKEKTQGLTHPKSFDLGVSPETPRYSNS